MLIAITFTSCSNSDTTEDGEALANTFLKLTREDMAENEVKKILD